MNRTYKALILSLVLLASSLPCFGNYVLLTIPETYHLSFKQVNGEWIGTGPGLTIDIQQVVNDPAWGEPFQTGAWIEFGWGSPMWCERANIFGMGTSCNVTIPASAFHGSPNPGGPYNFWVYTWSTYFRGTLLQHIGLVKIYNDGAAPTNDDRPLDDTVIGGGGGKPKEPKPPAPSLCQKEGPNRQDVHQTGGDGPLNIGDPVNLLSGNFYLEETDCAFKSRTPLYLTRSYNSIDTRKSSFGRGWSSVFSSRLVVKDTSVTFVNSDGAGVLFNKTGDTFVPSKPTIALNLTLATDTSIYSVSHPKGETWSFDSNGRLLQITQACCGRGAADTISFDYDASNRVQKVTNPAGQWFECHYDGENRVASVTDSAGRSFGYSYDATGNLTTATDPLGRVTQYSYDADGFMTSVVRPGSRTTLVTYADKRVTAVTDPNGNRSTFEWTESPRKVILTEANGTAHSYLLDEGNQIKEYTVGGVTKTYLASGSFFAGYQTALGNEWTYTYNAQNLISAITDPTGAKVEYEYHPIFQQITKKKDALGREWNYVWCPRGNLRSETDPAGGVATFGYDAWNNRTSRTDPLGRMTRYEYDSGGNYLLRTIDPIGGVASFTHDSRGNLLTASDPLGRVTTFEYDLLDRITKTIYPDGRTVTLVYDAAGNIGKRTDHLGRETQYAYDADGRVTQTTRPDGSVSHVAYDQQGRKISETDSLNRETRFEYDAFGRLVKTIYPDNTQETMVYDADGRLTSRADELGNITLFEYDPLGRLLATIDPAGARSEATYDSVGRKIEEKDPLGRVTACQFDILDRITKITRPDGTNVVNAYDAVGNLLSTIDGLGNMWSWKYDSLDRQYQAIRPDGATSTTEFDAGSQVLSDADPYNRKTTYTYDLGGRKTKTVDPLGNAWTNTYDALGRLIKATDPLGASSLFAYDLMDRVVTETDPLGNSTKYEYDAAGRRVAKVDALGRRSVMAYDDRDRPVGQSDPAGRTVSFGYDAGGRRVRLTDGANRTWQWAYDAVGRITMETDPLGNNVLNGYDLAGNRTTRTNARGGLTTYVFDAMDRMVKATYPNGVIATFAYDLESRELSRSSAAGTVTKQWDAVGNLVNETFGPWNKSWSYTFDKVGNRIQAKSPEGQTYKYGYDAVNRLTVLDPAMVAGEISFSYDGAGRPIGIKRPGAVSTNTFDQAGRLLKIVHERSSGRDRGLAMRQYAYDAVGNRLAMKDEDNFQTTYAYDKSDWLTRVVYPNQQVVSYAYNGAGDRLTETIETPKNRRATDTRVLSYTYDGGGRMITGGGDTFAYDQDGNLITETEKGEETRYFWSPDNRLQKVEREFTCGKHSRLKCRLCRKPDIATEEYAYLPEDWRRISRKADGQECFSVYDAEDESHEYLVLPKALTKEWKFGPFCWKPKLAKVMLLSEFVGGPGTDDIEATRYHGRNLWHLKDALGSTIALTNKGGQPITKIGYDVWGNMRWPDDPRHQAPPCRWEDLDDWLDRFDIGRSFGFEHNPWHWGRHHTAALSPILFQGRRWDGFSNQYWHRNRFMNPKHGRFTSSDPLSFGGGNNLYIFANNNSALYIDSFGLLKGPVTGWDGKTKCSYTSVWNGFHHAEVQRTSLGDVKRRDFYNYKITFYNCSCPPPPPPEEGVSDAISVVTTGPLTHERAYFYLIGNPFTTSFAWSPSTAANQFSIWIKSGPREYPPPPPK